jgi:ubiquitin C-terminal hydrolase
MFCYYGQHYHAFIFIEEIQQWVMFDDAHVSPVGEWPAVIRKCTIGRIQPLVLFYKR